eukprot:m.827847 g.827847  ORF g.827847 m.827847 type:complete len:220 (-) comp23418_c0_seq9:518-1177(-)
MSEASTHGQCVLRFNSIRRAHAAAATADLRVCVQDASAPPAMRCYRARPDTPCDDSNNEFAAPIAPGVGECMCAGDGTDIGSNTMIILNKADLLAHAPPIAPVSAVDTSAGEPTENDGRDVRVTPDIVHNVSIATKLGTRRLMATIESKVAELCTGTMNQGPIMIQARHRAHLANCVEALDRVLSCPSDVVIAAEELRFAAEQFGHITGLLQGLQAFSF